MMSSLKTAICTISTASHMFKSKALFDSLDGLTEADFFCLLTDADFDKSLFKNLTILPVSTLKDETSIQIINKYHGDALRWACKPLFIIHLFNLGYDRVIYVDNDICFYSSPDFIFEQLESSSVLLTPHFYPFDPTENQDWLEANYRVGLYNAGFIAASKNGVDAIKWWANCCLYNVKIDFSRGLYVDQKYLDLMPVIFDDVFILKHRGCNVAAWNIRESKRSVRNDGIMLNASDKLVFIHYNIFTIKSIVDGEDPILAQPLKDYELLLQNYNPNYTISNELGGQRRTFQEYLRHRIWRFKRLFE